MREIKKVFVNMGIIVEHDKEEIVRKPKGLITKVLDRCRSMWSHRKYCYSDQQKSRRYCLPPEGYFAVHVGPARERFAVRMEIVNHPLFRQLLDEAEMEYGYSTPGPLELPCDVEIFRQVLSEMEQEESDQMAPRCSLMMIKARQQQQNSGYRLLSHGRSQIVVTWARFTSCAII